MGVDFHIRPLIVESKWPSSVRSIRRNGDSPHKSEGECAFFSLNFFKTEDRRSLSRVGDLDAYTPEPTEDDDALVVEERRDGRELGREPTKEVDYREKWLG